MTNDDLTKKNVLSVRNLSSQLALGEVMINTDSETNEINGRQKQTMTAIFGSNRYGRHQSQYKKSGS